MEKPILYFAHPVNTYDTPLEAEILKLIRERFPEVVIENPNQPHHQKAYLEWKKKYQNVVQKSGMTYFYDIVLPKCNYGTIALPFLDEKIGAGVAGETIFSLKKGRGAWLIEPNLNHIRSFRQHECELLLKWEELKDNASDKIAQEEVGNELVLSIKETRAYTWKIMYKVFKSYDQSHLDKIMLLE